MGSKLRVAGARQDGPLEFILDVCWAVSVAPYLRQRYLSCRYPRCVARVRLPAMPRTEPAREMLEFLQLVDAKCDQVFVKEAALVLAANSVFEPEGLAYLEFDDLDLPGAPEAGQLPQLHPLGRRLMRKAILDATREAETKKELEARRKISEASKARPEFVALVSHLCVHSPPAGQRRRRGRGRGGRRAPRRWSGAPARVHWEQAEGCAHWARVGSPPLSMGAWQIAR